MNIVFAVTGHPDHPDNVAVDWPVVPQVGETVKLPGLAEYDTNVRTVVHYPFGDDEDCADPYVYVVLGPARVS